MSSYKSAKKDMEIVITIAEKVDSIGGTTYFVGGYCRDRVMGVFSKDIDIEIYGITVDQLRTILDGIGERVEHGKSFGVFGLKGYTIDIALPRRERCTGNTHTDFEVTVDPNMSTYEGVLRRDLTMNSIMINVLTNKAIDHFNGVEDIEKGIIRHINNRTFKEDPLRVLRVAQFAARFDFTVAPETIDLCKSMNIITLSKERVYAELEKALTKSIRPSIFFNVLKDMGQLSYWFKEVEQLINLPQNELYHPEGDVYNHTMLVLDTAKLVKPIFKSIGFMLAAITHDMGKIVTIDTVDGITHSYRHEEYGEEIANRFLHRFTDDKRLINYVCNLTKLHMMPHQLFNNNSRIKKTNHMFDKCLYPHDLVVLAFCDTMGKDDVVTVNKELDWLEDRYKVYMEMMSKPCVKGEDLIANGLKPGPYFSEILSFTHKLRLAGISKEDALHQALLMSRKLIAKQN